MKCDATTSNSPDMLSNPLLALALFCLPAIAIVATGHYRVGGGWRTAVWTAALSIMGTACLANAVRCGRVHCHSGFSPPPPTDTKFTRCSPRRQAENRQEVCLFLPDIGGDQAIACCPPVSRLPSAGLVLPSQLGTLAQQGLRADHFEERFEMIKEETLKNARPPSSMTRRRTSSCSNAARRHRIQQLCQYGRPTAGATYLRQVPLRPDPARALMPHLDGYSVMQGAFQTGPAPQVAIACSSPDIGGDQAPDRRFRPARQAGAWNCATAKNRGLRHRQRMASLMSVSSCH